MTNQTLGMKSEKTSYYYKLFRVKRSDGRVTTVSMDPILVARACQALGGLTPVSKLVRQAALAYETTMHKNCSGYVSQELRQALGSAPSRTAQLSA